MSNGAATLLELLKHTDGATLLVLLDRKNLGALLKNEGWSDAQIKSGLKGKEHPPGDLLLKLFTDGRKTEDLLAILGPEALAQVEAQRSKKSASAPSPSPSASRDANREGAPVLFSRKRPVHTAGLVLVLLAGLGPGVLSILDLRFALFLMVAGVAPVLACVAAVGALGGALFARDRAPWWAGAVGGASVSAGGLLAIAAYVFWGPGAGRSSILRLEIVVAFLAGSLPGILAYVGLSRLARRQRA